MSNYKSVDVGIGRKFIDRICKLNPDQKELLTLLYRDGYTLSEVADRIYHTSVAAVSLRLSRIQKRIRQFVAENGGLRND